LCLAYSPRCRNHIVQLGQSQFSVEKPQTAVRGGDEPVRVNVFQSGIQTAGDFLNRFNPGFGNGNHSEHHPGGFEMFQQRQIIVAVGIFKRNSLDA